MNRSPGDILNLASKATPLRIWNAFKVLLSYFITRATSKPVHWGLPISISVEPTTSCNLRCPQCPSGLRSFTRNTGMLPNDLLQKTIDELAPTLAYVTFYFQGEPFLNKDFLEQVHYASSKNIYTSTSTNAHYLNDEMAKKTVQSGLDRLIISIDGADQETYAKYRVGGSLEKVLEGTQNIVKWKKALKSSTPHIIWQFIVFRHNENQIDEIKNLGKQFGVDEVSLKTAQIYDYQNSEGLVPENENYSRYVAAGLTYKLKNRLLNHCWRLWNSSVVTWDGQVVPCCFDKDAKHSLGSLSTHTFRQIWNNSNYLNFRASVTKSRKNIDICSNCSEGTKVWEA